MMKKTVVLLLALAGALALSVNAFAADEASWWAMPEEAVRTDAEPVFAASGTRSEAPFSGRYFDQLDHDGQQIYLALRDAVRAAVNGEEKAYLQDEDGKFYFPVRAENLTGLTEENYETYLRDCYYTVRSAFENDLPREEIALGSTVSYFDWDTYRNTWHYVDQTGHSPYLVLYVYAWDDYAIERIIKLDAAVDEFYDGFTSEGMPDKPALEQYRYIHDYLCKNCFYNHDAVHSVSRDDPGYEAFEMAHCAYGALVELTFGSGDRGGVVCEGYSEAFELLCQRVGLPCATVDGDGDMSGDTLQNNHEWNIIRPYDNGVWYAVDVTWDDERDDLDDLGYQDALVFYQTWTYRYFADNRYFTAHEGEPRQDHAAMTQIRYAIDGLTLEAPALTADYIAEVDEWVPEELLLRVPDGAKASRLSEVIGVLRYNNYNARMITVQLVGDLDADARVTVPDGDYLRLFGNTQRAAPAIRRGESYAGVLFSVDAGGMLDLFDVALDGNGVPATGAMLDLGAGTEDHRAIAELCRCAVTGSRGAYAVTTAANAKLYLSDSVSFTDNLIGEAAADIDLADTALLHFNYTWNGGVTGDHVNPQYAWLEATRDGVYVSFFSLEDATLCCAIYTEEGGRMLDADSLSAERGFHTYCFSRLTKDYNGMSMRLFALRGDGSPIF
ncbi:MAG: hypothetical protein IKN81_06965 [Oscillospiraceae bacterium]|nr:hypothetical protein [Oscillospiraceae bacterium]